MNIRQLLGIGAALVIGGLVVAIPGKITQVSFGPTTPGTIDDCNKFAGGHVRGKATKLFRITVSNFAALGQAGTFTIEEYILDAHENPQGTPTSHNYTQAGDEPGNVTPLDLNLNLDNNSDPSNGKHKKILIEIVNNDVDYPFRDDEFVIVPVGDDSKDMFCDYYRSSIKSNVVKFRAHFKDKRLQGSDRRYGKYLIGIFTPNSRAAASPTRKPIRVPIFIDPMVQNYG